MSRVAAPLLHVLGAGPWQLPTIRRAKALGYRVLATDAFADRPGFEFADRHELADITDADATLAAARRHGIDGVLCDTTDTGVLTAAIVADALGLPGVGVEAARRCTDKASMTRCAAEAGLPVPATQTATSPEQARRAAAAMGPPWVIKPVDAQAGKGVSRVESPAALDAAIARAFDQSRRRELIVQAWQDGIEVIVDSFTCADGIHVLGVARKTPYRDNPTVSSRITYGDEVAPLPRRQMMAAHRDLLRALGLQQGLAHAEYLVQGDRIVPIDVAARGGGVMIYPLVLSHLSGVDLQRMAIEQALGRGPATLPEATGRAANIEFLRAAPGILRAVEGIEAALSRPGVAAVHLNLRAGEPTGDLAHKDRRLGHVVTLADTQEQAIQQGEDAVRMIRIDVAPVAGAHDTTWSLT